MMKTITAMLSVLTLSCTVTAADLPFKPGDKIAFLGDSITQNGVITEEGAPADLFDHPKNLRTQQFLHAVL